MRIALIDSRMSAELQNALRSYADYLIPLPPFERLPAPVASHSDMLLWVMGKHIVTYAEYYSIAKEQYRALESVGYNIIRSHEDISDIYPNDIHLNCANVGKYIIGHTEHMSNQIKSLAQAQGMTLLHTKQGYSKCSAVTVSDGAIITADKSVAKVSQGAGIDVLEISAGYVRLDGYDTGFIGGASGVTPTEVLFCGNLDTHPDAQKIRDFIESHGKRAVSLTEKPLYDYGTVMFL